MRSIALPLPWGGGPSVPRHDGRSNCLICARRLVTLMHAVTSRCAVTSRKLIQQQRTFTLLPTIVSMMSPTLKVFVELNIFEQICDL